MAEIRNFQNLLLSWSLVTLYTEALTNPIIQLSPEQPAYVVGERIIMRCVTNNPTAVSGYTFYKDAAAFFNTTSNIFPFSNLNTSDSGMYFCSYYMEDEEKRVSNILNLIVLEQPLAPTLFVMPQRIVFVTNQSVVLQCQLPVRQSSAITGINLYKNNMQTSDSDNHGFLNYTRLQIKNTGNYSCDYTMTLSGRIFHSQLSNIVILIVIELPPTPRLRYAYSNHNLARQVELACDIQNTPVSQVNGYRFYRNGIEIASRQANSFVLNYTLIYDGCYSCQTFVTILGEEILSPKSIERFLSVGGKDEGQCRKTEDTSYILSTQGLKFYGSILAGKLLVLISILSIFGVYSIIIQQRKQKAAREVTVTK